MEELFPSEVLTNQFAPDDLSVGADHRTVGLVGESYLGNGRDQQGKNKTRCKDEEQSEGDCRSEDFHASLRRTRTLSLGAPLNRPTHFG